MITRFKAKEFETTEPLGMRIGFAGESDSGEHYFILARDDGTLGERLPINEIYSELDDQGGGGYGLVSEILLRPDRIRVERTFGSGEKEIIEIEIEMELELSQEEKARLYQAFRQAMLGCERHLKFTPVTSPH